MNRPRGGRFIVGKEPLHNCYGDPLPAINHPREERFITGKRLSRKLPLHAPLLRCHFTLICSFCPRPTVGWEEHIFAEL
uniref:Uncharacterized protein n=1 Tax=Oryza nivara TaxID=4536 RepID=A0A0E0HCG4_ORYNI